jgi:hypothetical protein
MEAAHHEENLGDDDEVVSALSTAALEQKLLALRDQSNKHSQLLTQKLATSQFRSELTTYWLVPIIPSP